MTRSIPSALVLGAVSCTLLTAAGGSASAVEGSPWRVQRVAEYRQVVSVLLGGHGEVAWTERESPQFSMAYAWQDGKTTKLGTGEATANAMNDAGTVVGWSDHVAGGGYVRRVGRLVGLLGPRRGNAVPVGIDAAGDVVGALEPVGAGRWYQHAFLWRGGRLRDLGALGGRHTVAGAINDRGEIVGTAVSASNEYLLWLRRGGRMRGVPTAGWSNLQPLALTNRGEVFGFGSPPHSGRTEVDFLWRRGRIIDLGALGGHRSDAAAVDRRGRVVGWFVTAAGDRHAFLWQDGRLRDLGTLGGRLSEARAVDESGRVVGTSTTRGGETHGFLWRSGRMTDLGRFVPHAVNGRGQMLGRTGRQLVLWTPG